MHFENKLIMRQLVSLLMIILLWIGAQSFNSDDVPTITLDQLPFLTGKYFYVSSGYLEKSIIKFCPHTMHFYIWTPGKTL